jgi:hypothetical protein
MGWCSAYSDQHIHRARCVPVILLLNATDRVDGTEIVHKWVAMETVGLAGLS